MQLTTEVREVLERYRTDTHCRSDTDDLADAMLRLFPTNHHDPITPERLIAAEFEKQSYLFKYRDCESSQVVIEIAVHPSACLFYGVLLPAKLLPRNMGEVLELIQRSKEGT